MSEARTKGETEYAPIRSFDITMTPVELRELRDRGELKDKRVVVVDVLRATSTIITALQNGAKEIIPVATVEEARKLKEELGGDALLCGERGGQKLQGFDLGNSPREYTEDRVNGKIIILTTSHGAQTIDAACGAQEILIASALNASAVSRYIKETGGDIVLAASGSVYAQTNTGGRREQRGGKEDIVAGCGLVLNGLGQHSAELKKPWLKKLSEVAGRFAQGNAQAKGDSLLRSGWGQRMLTLDKQDGTDEREQDVRWIAENTNRVSIVPVVGNDGRIRIQKVYSIER